MRARTVIVAVVSFTVLGSGQLTGRAGHVGQSGRVSPHESVSETIAGARLTITYGRPSMRGRSIFGSLVPFDQVWCPGADEATTFAGTRPVRFGTVAVPSGPHTIWMLPTSGAWTLVISKEQSGFHTDYHANADLARLPLDKRVLSAPVEQLTFAISRNPDSPAGNGGVMTMRWETTEVSARFTVVP
jgi:hypothetical protein